VTDYHGGLLRDQQAAPLANPYSAAYPPPSAADVRQALTALCVLPLISAALHDRCNFALLAQCDIDVALPDDGSGTMQLHVSIVDMTCHKSRPVCLAY
jgi:hypothetical protein